MIPTREAIERRILKEAFKTRLLDNSMRGFWCEFMVAEALGPDCHTVGLGWHPWDLQIGDSRDVFPDRIRIQVKNSAALQTWHPRYGTVTDCCFNLTLRNRPRYFTQDNPNVPCESTGFMCDIFVLCHHPETDVARADHCDPTQWRFYLAPVAGPCSAVTPSEMTWLADKVEASGKPSTTMRRPATLEKGIRGRPPIRPLRIDELSIGAIRTSLGG